MNRRRRAAWLPRLAVWGVVVAAIPLPSFAAEQSEAWQDPERLVSRLYDLVTFPPGTVPDWDEVRACFLEEAVIVLRTAPEATTVFTVDGFVEDFVAFIERAEVRRSGFTERIVRMKPLVFGDIAHVLVLYEASVPGSARQTPALTRSWRGHRR